MSGGGEEGFQAMRVPGELPELALLERATGIFARRPARVVALLVVALTLALNLIPYWIPTPDSAVYLSLARSLVRGDGYQVDDIPHTLYLPGFPLMLSAVFRAAGENYLVMNLIEALFGMGCVLLTIALLRRWVGGHLAVVLAVLTGMNEGFIRWSSRVLTDVPHLFFVLLGLLLIQEMRRGTSRASRLTLALLVGPTMLAAGMIRLNGLLLVPVAVAVLLWPRRNRLGTSEKLLVLVVWTALIAGGLVAWYCHVSSVPEVLRNTYLDHASFVRGPAYLLRRTVETVRGLPEQFAESLFRNAIVLSGDVLVVAVVALGLVRLARGGGWHLALFTVLQVGLLSTQELMRRYLLVVLPFIVTGFVMGVAYLAVLIGSRRGRGVRSPEGPAPDGGGTVRPPGRFAAAVVLFFIVGVIVSNLVPTVKGIVQVQQRPFYENYRRGKWREPLDLARWMRTHTRPEEVFWAGEGTQAGEPDIISYRSDRRVRGPASPCPDEAGDPLRSADRLLGNLLYWKPDDLIVDVRDERLGGLLDVLVGDGRIEVLPLEVPGLKRLKLLKLAVPRPPVP